MSSQDIPLDEIQWKSPPLVQQMQGVHENSVLHYFSNSPFFDPTSNNAILVSQAMYNPNMLDVIQTRAAFEGRLKTMSGLEFIIAEQPAEMAPGTGTGVWVIRKQTRRKKDRDDDEITVHSTYFVVGENIYMAPTVADVLGNRTMSIIISLKNFISGAGKLPEFSPALGHIYAQPSPSTALKPINSHLSQGSKEPTPLPESLQGSKKGLPSLSTTSSSFLDNRLLEETINISLKYGDEYMDDIPITGAPGEFHLSSTGRNEAAKLLVPTITVQPSSDASKPTTPAPPSPLKTEILPEKKTSKGEKSPKTPGMPKPKRRKSKGLNLVSGGANPTT
ncbi:related to RNA polymerase II transcriptional regulation mediator MED6 [Rhynchosporium agropyri]|uniref:Mediator of RNA polymerase II transcription subunit 6 n=1 Tax=Rhynchosporium agropyri TaxID=914238 RepID=A0A1E1K8H4_9HELO|nr:related to RNA polymerase II transcriptional regulation mediator MED6 [Rhynchosporium agropyri]